MVPSGQRGAGRTRRLPASCAMAGTSAANTSTATARPLMPTRRPYHTLLVPTLVPTLAPTLASTLPAISDDGRGCGRRRVSLDRATKVQLGIEFDGDVV